jgi:hypothetical protein
MFELPWSVPLIPVHAERFDFLSTAVHQQADPNSTASYLNNVAGPTVAMPPAPEPPRIGRPQRGDRAKVKAGRKQRRTTH